MDHFPLHRAEAEEKEKVEEDTGKELKEKMEKDEEDVQQEKIQEDVPCLPDEATRSNPLVPSAQVCCLPARGMAPQRAVIAVKAVFTASLALPHPSLGAIRADVTVVRNTW